MVIKRGYTVIDYYYEFDAEKSSGGYGFIRGFHPEDTTEERSLLHSHCWTNSARVWLENANGAVLVRDRGREVHERINPRELAWVKLQARDMEQ